MADRPHSRSSVLAGFALGGGALYLVLLVAGTLGLGESVPVLGWIGFGVVAGIVAAVAGGLAVFLVRSARGAGAAPVLHPAAAASVEPTRRVLLVAEAECPGAALCDALVARSDAKRLEVFVAAPALVSPLHYLDSDVDEERAAAQARLDELLALLAAAGVRAQGGVGSESPLEAIADALAVFPADEVVIAAADGEPANWLDRDLLERTRSVHGLPVSRLAYGR